MGGFLNWAVIYPLSILESMPAVPSSPASADDYVTAAGTFGLKSGETPIFIYSTEAKVGYTADIVGERDGISYEQKVTFFYPGLAKDIASFATRIKNMPCIIVIGDADGNQYMVGSKDLPAYIAPALNGGQARADLRGTTFEGSCASNQSAVFLGTPLSVDTLTGTVTQTGSTPQ